MTAFVLGPAAAAAAQYNITGAQVAAVRQYLGGLVRADVAPGFQAGVLGKFGGLSSGGPVVARTVEEWMDGRVNAAIPLNTFQEMHTLGHGMSVMPTFNGLHVCESSSSGKEACAVESTSHLHCQVSDMAGIAPRLGRSSVGSHFGW